MTAEALAADPLTYGTHTRAQVGQQDLPAGTGRQDPGARQDPLDLAVDPYAALRIAADLLAPPQVEARLEKYWYDPVAFIEDIFPSLELYPYQKEILDQIPRLLRERIKEREARAAFDAPSVEAGASQVLSGRTIAPGRDWKIVTTASVARQLTQYLWPEVHKWTKPNVLEWDKLGRPPFSPKTELLHAMLRLEHGEAFAATPDDPANIEGAHADYIMYVIDESKTVPDPTWDAIEGALSTAPVSVRLCARGPHGLGKTALVSTIIIWFAVTREEMSRVRKGVWIGREALSVAISTPGEPTGRFYSIQSHKPGYEDWWTRYVTLHEAMDAGAITKEWAEQRALQWGTSSALYQNRVLGEFAVDASDGVVPLSWAEQSMLRSSPPSAQKDTRLRVICADIARQGADRNALAMLCGWEIQPVIAYHSSDTMEVTGKVVQALQRYAPEDADVRRMVAVGATHPFRPKIGVDVIGLGAGVVDRLREMGFEVFAFNASNSAGGESDASGELQFLNLRAAAWWRMRELLDPNGRFAREGIQLALPNDEELLGDLCTPHYETTSTGRIKVEDKDDIRKRLGRSPDKGDAVVMACFLATASTYGAKPSIRTLEASGGGDASGIFTLDADGALSQRGWHRVF